ncbi:hypothetical protein Scep_008246 [Stephania cephalantha]|uniref:Uncharacterized protein n=1 Tax=Stephania cephalantha TaxID=152367 RepID=A0AAP0KDE3_9MAGN
MGSELGLCSSGGRSPGSARVETIWCSKLGCFPPSTLPGTLMRARSARTARGGLLREGGGGGGGAVSKRVSMDALD